MKRLILLAQLLFSASLFGQDVKELAIIVSKEEPVSSMSLDQVREIFLKNDASELYVARDMNEGSSERTLFAEKVLRMTLSQLRQHWGAKMNEGYEEWPRKNSAAAIISFVSRGGRIGYVNASELSGLPKSEEVKVILTVK